jgi:hypothetical protein
VGLGGRRARRRRRPRRAGRRLLLDRHRRLDRRQQGPGQGGRDPADNKIVVAGLSGPPGNFNFAVARYSGGAGTDKLSAANGKQERVDCGAGRRNSAVVDRRDRVKGCERVRRRR